MTGAEQAALAVAAVLAAVNWWAVHGRRHQVEVVVKPATTLALVGLAAVAGSLDGSTRTWLVAAVVLGLLGDVALLEDSEPRFMARLGAFALGHVAYVVTALMVGVRAPRLLWAVPFLALLLGFRFVGRTVPGARRAGGAVLMGAVVGYAMVISAMVLTATGTAHVAAAVGAMTFAVSDWLIGHDRFVQPRRGGSVAIMVTYHVGQALLILGLAHGA